MKWITNGFDPNDPRTELLIQLAGGNAEQYRKHVVGKVIGEPKATRMFSVEELQKLGVVGFYKPTPRPKPLRHPA